MVISRSCRRNLPSLATEAFALVVVKAPHVRTTRHKIHYLPTNFLQIRGSLYAGQRCSLACQLPHAMTADETKRLMAYRHSITGMLKQVASGKDVNIAESSVKPLMSKILSFCKDFPDLAAVLTAQPRSCDGAAERYYIRKTVVDDAVRVIVRIDAELV